MATTPVNNGDANNAAAPDADAVRTYLQDFERLVWPRRSADYYHRRLPGAADEYNNR